MTNYLPKNSSHIVNKLDIYDRYCNTVIRASDYCKQKELLEHYRTISRNWNAIEVPTDFDPLEDDNILF